MVSNSVVSRFSLLVRGVVARGGLSGLVLIVAIGGVAAAAMGPMFYGAAEHSILAEAAHGAPTVAQGVEVSAQQQLSILPALTRAVRQARRGTPAADLLARMVRGQEISFAPAPGQTSVLAWRQGLCRHLVMSRGRCPRASGELAVSAALARLDGLAVGDRLPSLKGHVVGVYEPVQPTGPYWFNRGYFPQETPQLAGASLDAVFTVPATFAGMPAHTQGTSVVDLLLDVDGVSPARVGDLRATVERMSRVLMSRYNVSATTGISAMLDRAAASSRALAVPVVVITAQMLALVWLLLFLTISDAVDARGGEVALAKLRGLNRRRTLWVGIAEPVTVLLAALPLGLAVGFAVTWALSHQVLRAGTPVGFGWMSVAAAVLAISGGVAAAALAARRTLTRPVLEQWRRGSSQLSHRGWVLEAGLLVATVAGLVELFATGTVGSGSADVLALLVPGLLGLGVAVLAARVMPWACGAVVPLTRRHGGLGGFLAVRQVARRPAAMRTLMLVTASFALATFAVSAWAVDQRNVHDVAATRVGAAAVLDVVPKPGQDLSATVDRIDPTGHSAMAVESYTDFGAQGRRTIAVQASRLARVAYWRHDFSAVPLATLAKRLAPPAPDPVSIDGDRIRIRLSGVRLAQPLALWLQLKVPDAGAPTPVELGGLTAGTRTVQAPLPPCPCVLRDLLVTSSSGQVSAASGRLTVTEIDVHTPAGWTRVPAGLTDPGRWAFAGKAALQDATSTTATPRGLRLRFDAPVGTDLTWTSYAWPHPLPALATAGVAAHPGKPVTVAGLDGSRLRVRPIAIAPVPGAPDGGVILDRKYALRAAFDTSYSATHQVWLAPDAVKSFPTRLRQAGVKVLATRTVAATQRDLLHQGPSLAILLFLLDAAAAALLAAAGAVTALQASSRRRRYEFAALHASGARRRTLAGGLLLEQGLVLGAAAVAGLGAGLLAVLLAMPAVPQFVTPPGQPDLLYRPDWLLVTVPVGATLAAVTLASLAGVAVLVARLRPQQLREGEP